MKVRIFEKDSNVDNITFGDSCTMELWGTTIERLPSGKPTLKNTDLNISISHTANYWAIMDSDTVCGLDIELRTRKSDHLYSRFATEEEMDICRAVFEENPSLLIWCAKEALYKVCSVQGTDFIHDLQITRATDHSLEAIAHSQVIILNWYIENDLLVVHTL